jgi:hypothetical protein
LLKKSGQPAPIAFTINGAPSSSYRYLHFLNIVPSFWMKTNIPLAREQNSQTIGVLLFAVIFSLRCKNHKHFLVGLSTFVFHIQSSSLGFATYNRSVNHPGSLAFRFRAPCAVCLPYYIQRLGSYGFAFLLVFGFGFL